MKMVDSITKEADSKYWVPVGYKQQQTKENTLKWSSNENNAVTDSQIPGNTNYRISAYINKKSSNHIAKSLSILDNPKIQ